MDRKPVSSSNVVAVSDYDPVGGVVEVEFRGGVAYRHIGVPKAIYEGFIESKSKGAYYYEHFRNRYGCERL